MKSILAAALIAAAPMAAFAQEAPSLSLHRFTIGGGVVWSGGYDIGDQTAQLRGNGAGPSAPPFTLFTSESRLTSAISPDVRVAFAMTRQLTLEFGTSVRQPHISVAIDGDAEAPSQELPGEKLEQYLFEGGATWQVPLSIGDKRAPASISERLAPFVSGGITFLRQLHEDRTLAETGQIYHAGGGARYFLKGGHGSGRALGVRGEARVNFRRKGIDFENKTRIYPTLTLSVFVGL